MPIKIVGFSDDIKRPGFFADLPFNGDPMPLPKLTENPDIRLLPRMPEYERIVLGTCRDFFHDEAYAHPSIFDVIPTENPALDFAQHTLCASAIPPPLLARAATLLLKQLSFVTEVEIARVALAGQVETSSVAEVSDPCDWAVKTGFSPATCAVYMPPAIASALCARYGIASSGIAARLGVAGVLVCDTKVMNPRGGFDTLWDRGQVLFVDTSKQRPVSTRRWAGPLASASTRNGYVCLVREDVGGQLYITLGYFDTAYEVAPGTCVLLTDCLAALGITADDKGEGSGIPAPALDLDTVVGDTSAGKLAPYDGPPAGTEIRAAGYVHITGSGKLEVHFAEGATPPDELYPRTLEPLVDALAAAPGDLVIPAPASAPATFSAVGRDGDGIERTETLTIPVEPPVSAEGIGRTEWKTDTAAAARGEEPTWHRTDLGPDEVAAASDPRCSDCGASLKVADPGICPGKPAVPAGDAALPVEGVALPATSPVVSNRIPGTHVTDLGPGEWTAADVRCTDCGASLRAADLGLCPGKPAVPPDEEPAPSIEVEPAPEAPPPSITVAAPATTHPPDEEPESGPTSTNPTGELVPDAVPPATTEA